MAKGMVQSLHARISKFPGPVGASLLAKLVDAEAGYVDGTWTPTQFWNWMSQGQEGVSQKEQGDPRATPGRWLCQGQGRPLWWPQ